jgi:hypothetical protein
MNPRSYAVACKPIPVSAANNRSAGSAHRTPSVVSGMPAPEALLTDAQLAQRYRDALSWVAQNAHCIETRRFVARTFRELEGVVETVKSTTRP